MIKTWVPLFDHLFERSYYHIKGFSDFKRCKKVVKKGDFMTPQKWGVSKSLQKVKNRFFPFLKLPFLTLNIFVHFQKGYKYSPKKGVFLDIADFGGFRFFSVLKKTRFFRFFRVFSGSGFLPPFL